MQYLGINIDPKRDSNFSEFSQTLLEGFYLRKGETIQKGFARAAVAYCQDDLALAQRIYDYASKGWFMFSSPVLSNAPLPGEKLRGLPISCYLTYVPDSIKGLIDHTAETRWLTVKGGGVGAHWSDVRSISDLAPGPIPFMHTMSSDMTAYAQGRTRRGSYAAYLDISHPDVEEFLSIRVPTGDVMRKALNLHHALNITDDFMEAVIHGDEWKLIDPNDKTVRATLPARSLWERIIETRARTGEPYLNFIDTANRALPRLLQNLGLKIHGSNLCNEIHLPTNADRTAVCCLCSVNLEYYFDWCNTTMVQDLTRFLDLVLTFFIKNCPPEMDRAAYSAAHERSLGLGAMGFHSLLQKMNLPVASPMAVGLNNRIFKHLDDESLIATEKMAEEWGEYPDGIGGGRRNSHRLAIAPNANSAILLDTSPSIELFRGNAFTHRTRAGAHLVKNRQLQKLLQLRGFDTPVVWSSIITGDESPEGSVQHLQCLSSWEKQVFLTSMEVDQRVVVDLAADRQKFICQGQSLNLYFPAGASRAYVSECHIRAWKKGCKGLYYLRTEASSSAETVATKVKREALKDSDCLACEG